MTKFDKFICEYNTVHSNIETIFMIESHIAYMQYCKYDHSVDRIKEDENRIHHNKAIVNFLDMIGDAKVNLKNVYFGDDD